MLLIVVENDILRTVNVFAGLHISHMLCARIVQKASVSIPLLLDLFYLHHKLILTSCLFSN